MTRLGRLSDGALVLSVVLAVLAGVTHTGWLGLVAGAVLVLSVVLTVVKRRRARAAKTAREHV